MEHQETMDEIGQKLSAVLTDKQWTIAKDFRPCLVPKKTDNGLIGQDGGSSSIFEMLSRIREVPGNRFEKALKKILSRTEERLMKAAKNNPEIDVNGELATLESVIRKVREMNDMEFR